MPKETELGRKRIINQSSCNKDYSCLKGFCPSFVTVTGGNLRKHSGDVVAAQFADLPEPERPAIDEPWNVLVTGIGGTGVLTISAIIAMAAHIEGKGCSTLNQTGLAQKFGSVVSHVRVSERQEDIHAVRIPAGDADLMLGCDLVVSASFDALAKLHIHRSHAVVNDYQSPTSSFIHHPDVDFPDASMKKSIAEEAGIEKTHFINATDIATQLLGDNIASNLFLLGFAFQKGLIPVSAEAIEQAIELNNVEVAFNQQAFTWGRRASHDRAKVEELAKVEDRRFRALTTLQDIIDWRASTLQEYQNAAYAKTYLDFVARVRAAERSLFPKLKGEQLEITKAVARYYFKLMAYKDEYEVARLYTNDEFKRQLDEQFEGQFKIEFNLAPPILSKRDKTTGQLLKRKFPQMTLSFFRVLAKLKFLRGTALDVFGYTHERKNERKLIRDYQKTIEQLLDNIEEDNYKVAVEIASLPKFIRGYGHIKEQAIEKTAKQQIELFDRFYHRENVVVRMKDRVA